MQRVISFLFCLVFVCGGAQVAFSGIKPAEFRNTKAGILSLRNTESLDFRVQAIELDGIVLDTVTTIQKNNFQYSSEFSNGGKLLFTPTSVFANVTAGNIDMELIAHNGTVATVVLNAGHSIEFEPQSFTIISSPTNAGNVSLFVEEVEFFVNPGERKQIVAIDIAPLDRPDRANADVYEIIPVVIYGSPTLDVSRIDISSLLLTGQDIKINGIINDLAMIDHVNNDNYPDLIVGFKDIDNGFLNNPSSATLIGNLSDGTTISGAADVTVAQ